MSNKVTSSRQYAACIDCKTRRLVHVREWDRVAQPRLGKPFRSRFDADGGAGAAGD